MEFEDKVKMLTSLRLVGNNSPTQYYKLLVHSLLPLRVAVSIIPFALEYYNEERIQRYILRASKERARNFE